MQSILALFAFSSLAIADGLATNGKQCIAGYTGSSTYIPGGDPLTGAGANTVISSKQAFLTDKDGTELATGKELFGQWTTLSTSKYPYTFDLFCGQDTSSSLVECTSCIVEYAGQHWTSGDNPDRCNYSKSSGPFHEEGLCACYVDC